MQALFWKYLATVIFVYINVTASAKSSPWAWLFIFTLRCTVSWYADCYQDYTAAGVTVRSINKRLSPEPNIRSVRERQLIWKLLPDGCFKPLPVKTILLYRWSFLILTFSLAASKQVRADSIVPLTSIKVRFGSCKAVQKLKTTQG